MDDAIAQGAIRSSAGGGPPSEAPVPRATHVPYGLHRSRSDLSQVLPLDTPFSILVDPSNACNFRCTFCATGDSDLLRRVGRPKGQMPLALFRKIVDDIARFPRPLKSLHLYKDGEPLANRDLPAMVAYAKAQGVADHVETTSNGALLTPSLSEALLAAGLDGLRISVYGTDDATYQSLTRGRAGYGTVLDNVRALDQRRRDLGAPLHLHCKLLIPSADSPGVARFLEDFGPLCDSLYVHPLHGKPSAQPGFEKTPAPGRLVCSEPFLKLAINFDGQVSVCCSDWAMQLIVGDVTRESLVEIWHGPKLRAFRLTQLHGARTSIAACRSCAYLATLPADTDIDAVRDSLLSRYASAADGAGLRPPAAVSPDAG